LNAVKVCLLAYVTEREAQYDDPENAPGDALGGVSDTGVAVEPVARNNGLDGGVGHGCGCAGFGHADVVVSASNGFRPTARHRPTNAAAAAERAPRRPQWKPGSPSGGRFDIQTPRAMSGPGAAEIRSRGPWASRDPGRSRRSPCRPFDRSSPSTPCASAAAVRRSVFLCTRRT